MSLRLYGCRATNCRKHVVICSACDRGDIYCPACAPGRRGYDEALIPARAIAAVPSPEDLVGSYRRFGDFGPVYEIQHVAAELPNGDALLHLFVPETSDEVDLPYSIVLRHPEAD